MTERAKMGVLFPLYAFIVVGLLTVLLTPLSLTWPRMHMDTLQETLRYRLVFDVREFNWYREEGVWFQEGFLPYVDRPYEYPVLATALFTLPALVADTAAGYHVLFRVLMIAAGVWLVGVTARALQEEGRPGLAWLLLLPSVCYFTLNRFDVFPALAVQVSLIALWRRWYAGAWVSLAISFLLKWYSGLLVPLYLLVIFERAGTHEERVRAFRGLLLFVGIVLAGHLWLLPFGGSLLDAMNPYAIHLTRSPEAGSLIAALLAPLGKTFISAYSLEGDRDVWVNGAVLLSSLAQLMGLLFVVWRGRKERIAGSLRAVAHAAFLVIGCFVLFNRVYSYQWIVWLVPLFILAQPTKRSIFLFIAFDIVNYLQFPLMYGTFVTAPHFIVFTLLTLVRTLLLGILLLHSARVLFTPLPVPLPQVVTGPERYQRKPRLELALTG